MSDQTKHIEFINFQRMPDDKEITEKEIKKEIAVCFKHRQTYYGGTLLCPLDCGVGIPIYRNKKKTDRRHCIFPKDYSQLGYKTINEEVNGRKNDRCQIDSKEIVSHLIDISDGSRPYKSKLKKKVRNRW